MAIFRCKKCNHKVEIFAKAGQKKTGLKHSYCGGDMERVFWVTENTFMNAGKYYFLTDKTFTLIEK